MKKVVRQALLIIFFLTAAVGITFSVAPFFIDAYILPRLLEKISIIDKFASISRITPFSASGTLIIKDGETPAVSVPRFELRYTPASLYQQRVSSLTIDNAIIHLSKDNGAIRIAGLSFQSDKRKATSPMLSSALLFPTAVENIILRQCSLIIHEEEQADIRFSLSSALHLSFDRHAASGFALSAAEGSFLLFDALTAKGKFSFIPGPDGYKLSVNLQAGLNQLPDRFVGRQTLISGSMDTNITAHFGTEHLQLKNLNAAGTIKNFQIKHEEKIIQGGGADSSVSFALSGSPAHLDYQLSSFSSNTPVPLVSDISGAGSYERNNLQVHGTIQNRLALSSDTQANPLSFPLLYDLELDTGSLNWQARLNGKYRGESPQILRLDDFTINVPDFELSSSLTGTMKGLTGTIQCAGRPFTLSRRQTKLEIAEISLAAQLERSEELTTAHLSGSIAAIKDQSSGMTFSNISLDLPCSFPFSPQRRENTGRLTVASLTYMDAPLFTASAELSQQQGSLLLSGDIKSLFSSDMHLQVQGAVEQQPLRARLNWKMDKAPLNSGSLPTVLTTMAGLDFNGFLISSGNLVYENQQISGSAKLNLDIDTFQVPEKNISITNISCGVIFPSLPAFFSMPSQRCSAGELVFGNLQFSDAEINFRVEDTDTVFIEKSSIKWCQGKLESTSLRLSRNNPEINTALYCSRINFSDLLNQFGLDQAEGQGSLNGKLPISLSPSGLAFDDGFLFSTPGTGGIIRFSNTDMLRQGVGSADVGGYLDYSMKAMEDFAYQWTKLSFNSSGDELLLTMELNGKPRTPLPYGFKKGVIIKTDKGEGLQYPIQLDVNFRLPLAELFHVGQNIQSIKENM